MNRLVLNRLIQDNLHLVRRVIEKINGEAVLINLDQSKALDRVDHCFLKPVLSVTRFKPYFCSKIHFLDVSPGSMVKVNRVKSKFFILSRYICQSCPTFLLFYVLALVPFLCRLRINLVLGRITLPGSTTLARYTLPGLLSWIDGSCKILVILSSLNLQLEKNWWLEGHSHS